MLVNPGPITLNKASATALAEGTRVKLTAGLLVVAGSADDEVGTLEVRALAGDLTGSVLPIDSPGVRHMIASEAISQYASVYAAAAGKVATSGTLIRGIALEAASGDGSVIKVLYGRASTPGNQTPNMAVQTLAAAGTVQGDAAALSYGFTLVTGSTNAGVLLPDAPAGTLIGIKNNVGGNMKVWPASGDAINAGAANAAYTMATLTSAFFLKYDGTTWYTIPLLAS